MKSNQNFDKLYSQLNPAQKEAVDTIEGPVIVLAGPGTGKTQVLAMRIGKILQETQINPANILCLTFTETGSFQMRQRLISILGNDGYYVRVHTFHSFCSEIISENPDRFLDISGLKPLDDVERIKIFQKLIDSLSATSALRPFGNQYFYLRDIISAISDLKRENITPDNYEMIIDATNKYIQATTELFENYFAIAARARTSDDSQKLKQQLLKITDAKFLNEYVEKIFEIHKDDTSQTALKDDLKKFFENTVDRLPKQEELIEIYRKYQQNLQESSRLDFEDLLLFVIKKFETDELLLQKYQEQFQYILVDEFQDTNGAQNKIINLLTNYFDDPNIFVVGDDDQSIFRFQGASLENIIGFWQLYKKSAKIISLNENYRSTQIVLDASASVIKNNTARLNNFFGKSNESLHANVKGDDLIKVSEFEWVRDENYFLVEKTKEMIANKISPTDIAIIYRDNSDANDLVRLFLQEKIPFKLYAGKNILNDILIIQLIRLFQVINDVSKSHELFLLMHSSFFDFDPVDLAKISLHGKLSMFEKISSAENLAEIGVSSAEKFLEFAKKLSTWNGLSVKLTFQDFFVEVVNQSNFLNFISHQVESARMLNCLHTLFEFVKNLNDKNHQLELGEFLEQIEILRENNIVLQENELETDRNAVSLLTAHKSKGLEFSHVFITRLLDKKWGNNVDRSKLKLPLGLISNQVIGLNVNDDERRLFYVAMTRAKKTIHLTYSLKNEESSRQKTPSMFIDEIDSKFVTREDPIIKTSLSDLIISSLSLRTTGDLETHKQYLLDLLKDYKVSVTHLNNYLTCHRLWYFQNLLRAPAVKDHNAAFGSAIHYALRDLFVSYYKNEKVDFGQLFIWFKKYLENEVLTPTDQKMALDYGQKHLQDYFNEYENKFIKTGFVEYDFNSHNVVVNGVPITGKLDKIEMLGKGKEINVVDYKTGNPDNAKRVEDYQRQIVFYKLLCEKSNRFEFEMVSGELDYIQKSKKTQGFVKKKFVVSDNDLKDLESTISRVYDEMKNLKFLDFSDEFVCGECEFCLHFQK